MNPLQAAFFLNKTAYAEADVVPHDTQVAGGETSRTMPDAPAYTPPPLPGGPLHPLYQRLALAKDHLDNEWRNWVASRGPDNPYGFMGYIAQHSPEARARAAKKALLMQQPPQKMAAMSEHALRREDGNGKFRKHKPGDERPASEEIAHIQVCTAAACVGRQGLGDFGCAVIRRGRTDDQITLLGQLLGNGSTDAAGSAGHQGNVLFVVAHVLLF